MRNRRGSSPQTLWIAEQIATAFAASRGGPPSAEGYLSWAELKGLVAQVLEEELERVEEEERDVKDLQDSKD